MAFTAYLVPLIYSPQFHPAEAVLEWQLAGSLFKFSSWTMSFVILARSGSSAYFFVELVAGLATICTAWLGIRWFGLVGLGIGFCVTYLIYYAAVWLVIRREINFKWESGNRLILAAAAFAAALVLAMSATNYEALKLPLNIFIAASSIAASSYVLLWKLNGLSTLRMRFSSR